MSQATQAAPDGQHSIFLNLPPELRLCIYEYALTESRSIQVTEELKEPGLLQTSAEIRRESFLIWHRNNSFNILVVDFDGRLLSRWTRHCASVGMSGIVRNQMRCVGEANWGNLMAWLKSDWEDRVGLLARKSEDWVPEMFRFLTAAQHLLHHHFSTRSWAEFELAMMHLRYAVSTIDWV